MKFSRTALSCGIAAVALLVPASTALAAPVSNGAAVARQAAVRTVPAFDTDLPAGSARVPGGVRVRGQKTSQSAAASWVCTVYASDPRKSGIFVEGDGSQFCSGAGFAATKITVKVQRHRWYGWQTMNSQSTSWSSASFRELVDVAYDCSGDGTYTYRMVTTGYANGGAYAQSVQSLNYLRVSC